LALLKSNSATMTLARTVGEGCVGPIAYLNFAPRQKVIPINDIMQNIKSANNN